MDVLLVFPVAVGVVVGCGVGAMIWGERRLVRATEKHRSG
jgi:hypothetical protein